MRPGADHFGELQAWDPASGKKVWSHNFPKSQLFGSVTATAGDLVLVGGTNDRMFRAFHAKTGELLWEQKTNSGIMGMPVAYALGLASIVAALYTGIPLEAVMLKVAGGMSGFSLLAIGAQDQLEWNDLESIFTLRHSDMTDTDFANWPEFHKRHKEIVEAGPAECVPPQSPQSPLVRPSPSRHADREVEERCVSRPLAEVVFTDRSCGRKNRSSHLVGPVGVVGTHAALLDAGKDGKRRPAGQRRNVQELPPRSQIAHHRPRGNYAVEGQRLDKAENEGMSEVICRGPFFDPRVARVSGKRLEHGA